MNISILDFKGVSIRIITQDHTALFNLEEMSRAIGYSKISAAEYHIKKRVVFRDGEKYVDVKAINYLAKKATRTPKAKEFASWAIAVQEVTIKPKTPPQISSKKTIIKPYGHTLREVATTVGMPHPDLITWMSMQGFLETYSSGHLKMTDSFKNRGLGMYPMAESGRVSNTIRITESGLNLIKTMLRDELSESSVLSFAQPVVVNDGSDSDGAADGAIAAANNHIYALDNSQIVALAKEIVKQLTLKAA